MQVMRRLVLTIMFLSGWLFMRPLVLSDIISSAKRITPK
jgi:hypothetical protein